MTIERLRDWFRVRCQDCGGRPDHWHVIDEEGKDAIVYKGASGPPIPTIIRRELERAAERIGRA